MGSWKLREASLLILQHGDRLERIFDKHSYKGDNTSFQFNFESVRCKATAIMTRNVFATPSHRVRPCLFQARIAARHRQIEEERKKAGSNLGRLGGST